MKASEIMIVQHPKSTTIESQYHIRHFDIVSNTNTTTVPSIPATISHEDTSSLLDIGVLWAKDSSCADQISLSGNIASGRMIFGCIAKLASPGPLRFETSVALTSKPHAFTMMIPLGRVGHNSRLPPNCSSHALKYCS